MALFDLLADPMETTNIATEYPDVVERIIGQLHERQRSVDRSLSVRISETGLCGPHTVHFWPR